MPFQKGQSGNPNGRKKKGQTTAELLRALGDLKYAGSDKTRKERAAEVVWEQACKGNLQAFLAIVERTEGKVPDKLDQTGRLTIRVIRE